MTQAITTTSETPVGLTFSHEQRQMIRDTLANGASEQEFETLMMLASARQLNPLLRECFFVKRWDNDKKRFVWQLQVSIDGFRAIADRTGRYDGQDEIEFEHGPEGHLVAAKARVWRGGSSRAFVAVAYYDEFVQKTKDGHVTRLWKTMPHVMLGKCAEAQALRKAFPQSLSGLYTPDEMSQAEPAEPRRISVDVAPARPSPRPEPVPRVEEYTTEDGEVIELRCSGLVSELCAALQNAEDNRQMQVAVGAAVRAFTANEIPAGELTSVSRVMFGELAWRLDEVEDGDVGDVEMLVSACNDAKKMIRTADQKPLREAIAGARLRSVGGLPKGEAVAP